MSAKNGSVPGAEAPSEFGRHLGPFIVICVLVVIMSATSFCILYNYNYTLGRQNYEVLLGVFGVSSVMLIATRTTNISVLILALLVCGTLVASEKFLVSLGLMFAKADKETSQVIMGGYATGAAGTGAAQRSSLPDLLSQLSAESRPIPNQTDDARAAQQRRIAQDIDDVAKASRVIDGNAVVPLTELARNDPENWRRWAREYLERDFFRSHMNILRDEGLAEIPENDLLRARPTQAGIRVSRIVAARSNERQSDSGPRTLSTSEKLPALDITNLSDPRIQKIARIGTEVDVVLSRFSSAWLSFDIVEEANYTIETKRRSESLFDTVLYLYEVRADGTLSEIESNDDGGVGLFSRISKNLRAATYVIQIRSFLEIRGDCRVSVIKN